jgi:guanosine-3',5'-bis(diphosphate) 3'-pyrophosphohydrolase
MSDARDELAGLLRAIHFAADKHRDQRRKDPEASPYVNHPIAVTELLASVGQVRDLDLLQAGVLHDTVEDTDTTPEEIERAFGPRVRSIVAEVTDDKSLPKKERKRLQVEHAPHLSPEAKQLKIVDKICNVRDVADHPPTDWDDERRREYLDWTEQVVKGCRGVNEALEREYDATLRVGWTKLGGRVP